MASATLPGSTNKNPVNMARLAGYLGMFEIQREISLVMIKFQSKVNCSGAACIGAEHKKND
jgi:hypothetical protein